MLHLPLYSVAVWIENVVVRANESALLGSVSYIPIARAVTTRPSYPELDVLVQKGRRSLALRIRHRPFASFRR